MVFQFGNQIMAKIRNNINLVLHFRPLLFTNPNDHAGCAVNEMETVL